MIKKICSAVMGDGMFLMKMSENLHVYIFSENIDGATQSSIYMAHHCESLWCAEYASKWQTGKSTKLAL